jgi:predicted GNAT family N-acyltransferase
LPGKEKTTRLRFEPLGPAHDRAAFSCGVEALDNYLRKQAGQDVRKRVAVAFVLTPDGKTVAGYYTLSQYSVELDAIPDGLAAKLPKYPFVPATLIGRLAVSNEFRGQRLGELLLMDALNRCLSGSKQVASAAVIVDAKDDGAAAFYKKYGFIELPKTPKRLFLPMATIEKLFVKPKRLVDPDDLLTPAEAKKVRHGMERSKKVGSSCGRT